MRKAAVSRAKVEHSYLTMQSTKSEEQGATYQTAISVPRAFLSSGVSSDSSLSASSSHFLKFQSERAVWIAVCFEGLLKFHSEDFSHLNLSQAEVGLLENRAASLTCEGNVSISVPFVEQASRSASVWQAVPDALSCKVFGQSVQRYSTVCREQDQTWCLCSVWQWQNKSNGGIPHIRTHSKGYCLYAVNHWTKSWIKTHFRLRLKCEQLPQLKHYTVNKLWLTTEPPPL